MIKMVSIAAICTNVPTTAFSTCTDLAVASSFALYVDNGLTNGGRISYLNTESISTLVLCAKRCDTDATCMFFDYNCQNGDCALYEGTGNDHSANQLVPMSGHASGLYTTALKK